MRSESVQTIILTSANFLRGSLKWVHVIFNKTWFSILLKFHKCLDEKIRLNFFVGFSGGSHVTIVKVSVHTNGIGQCARNKEQKKKFHFRKFLKIVANWVLYLQVLMGLINYDFHSWTHEFNFILWKIWATWYGPYDMLLGKNIYTSGARRNFIPDIRKLRFMAFVTLSKKSAFIVPRGIPYGYSWIMRESLDRINNYSNYCQTVRDVENQMVILLLIFLITQVNFLQTFHKNLPFIYAIFSKYWYRLNCLR